MTAGALPVLPFFWKTPGPLDLALFCSIGLIGGVSQFWVTQALHYAPAAAVSPFNYTALMWGSVLGFLIWSELPTAAVATGAASSLRADSVCCATKPGTAARRGALARRSNRPLAIRGRRLSTEALGLLGQPAQHRVQRQRIGEAASGLRLPA
jgi:hypothetical protein